MSKSAGTCFDRSKIWGAQTALSPVDAYLLSNRRKGIIKVCKRVNAQDTSAEPKPDLPLEIAHLLLIDVVGYSKLLVNEQIEFLQELNQIVRGTVCIRAAAKTCKLIWYLNRDGMTHLLFVSLDYQT